MNREPTQSQSIEIVFRGSLPYRLTGLLALLAEAPRFDGFDQQIYILHASLSRELRKGIELIFGPLGQHLIFRHLWRAVPELDDFSAFISWVSQIDSEAIGDAIRACLHRFAAEEAFRTGTNVAGLAAYDEEHLRKFLGRFAEPWKATARSDPEWFDRILHLLRDPTELKASLILILTQFWGTHFQAIDDTCTPIVKRSLQHHQDRRLGGNAGAAIAAVTGRELPDDLRTNLASVRRIVFVPSCHVGLFTTPIGLDRTFETILLQYNCRTSAGGEDALSAATRELFPMVKALSDETRLRILQMLKEGELYAQQIVDRLDLSQSSVSRHLNLLVTGGILKARWEGGVKFYKISNSAIDRLVARLTAFKREREGGEPLR